MGADQKLIEAATKLVEAAHKELDHAMPQRLAGIVKLHTALGVGAAWIPVPGLGLVAAGTAVWSMYYRINNELKMPFSENVLKSVASGVGTNLGAYVGVIGAAELLKFFPGIGSVAAGVMLTAVAYVLTLASGWVYMNLLTFLLKQKNAEDITQSDLENAIGQVMNDKASIQSFLTDAKAFYKEQDLAELKEKVAEQGVTPVVPSSNSAESAARKRVIEKMTWKCPSCGFENDPAVNRCGGGCGFARIPKRVILTSETSDQTLRMHITTTIGKKLLMRLDPSDGVYASDPQFIITRDETAGGWTVCPNDSAKNPTFYNGEKLGDSRVLANGGVLSIGPEKMRLRVALEDE